MLREIVLGLVEEVRRVQQRLGRDAADIEASASERTARLDARLRDAIWVSGTVKRARAGALSGVRERCACFS